VLLTTPLESFTIGHTIVLSRGLIDVLPDEASLAMVLAHELGHVLGRHELSTSYAFTDQVLIGDRQVLDWRPTRRRSSSSSGRPTRRRSPARGCSSRPWRRRPRACPR
jgi:hypothetical protein